MKNLEVVSPKTERRIMGQLSQGSRVDFGLTDEEQADLPTQITVRGSIGGRSFERPIHVARDHVEITRHTEKKPFSSFPEEFPAVVGTPFQSAE